MIMPLFSDNLDTCVLFKSKHNRVYIARLSDYPEVVESWEKAGYDYLCQGSWDELVAIQKVFDNECSR